MIHSPDLEPLVMDEDGASFFVTKLGLDAGPLQQYRELAVNSFEAHEAFQRILAIGQVIDAKYKPIIKIQRDPYYFSLGYEKYCHIDNGIGMTGDELVNYFGGLAVSSKSRAVDKNYGIGAKVTTAVHNPFGVEVRSWKDGVGSRVIIRQAGTTFGLHRWGDEEDGYSAIGEIADPLMKSDHIDQHGTMVILLGNRLESKTILPSIELEYGSGGEKRWNAIHLNRTFFTIPHGIVMSSYAAPVYGAETKSHARTVKGYASIYEEYHVERGVQQVSGAKIHWWILKGDTIEERKLMQPSTQMFAQSMVAAGSFANVATLHKEELFDFQRLAEAASTLKQFGIIAGWQNVAIFIEPTIPVESNITRTHLYLKTEKSGNKPLPWEEWAREFSIDLPDVLAKHVQSHLPDSMVNVEEYVADQIKKFAINLESQRTVAGNGAKTTQVASSQEGGDEADSRVVFDGGAGEGGGNGPGHGDREGGGTGGKGDRKATDVFGTKARGLSSKRQKALDRLTRMAPRVIFKDADSSDEMYERAGSYTLIQGVLYLNSKFKIFTDHLDFARSLITPEGLENKNVQELLPSLVERFYAAQCALAIVTALYHFKDKAAWSHKNILDMTAPIALSLAVSDIRSVRNDITREVGRNPITKRFYVRNAEQPDIEAA